MPFVYNRRTPAYREPDACSRAHELYPLLNYMLTQKNMASVHAGPTDGLVQNQETCSIMMLRGHRLKPPLEGLQPSVDRLALR
jgi:hypothetical protein